MIKIISRIPKILRYLRAKCELTQEQVAKMLGVDRSTYAYYESGRINPDIKMILSLAKIYGVEYTEILDSDAAVICADISKDIGSSSRKKTNNIYEGDEELLSKDEKSILMGLRLLSRESRLEIMRLVSQKIQSEKKRKKYLPKMF